jgi:Flp pilus assembly protein TadG
MLHKISQDDKGSVAVEMALLLPILLVFLAGIVEFGLAYWEQQILTTAAREGARAGAKKVNGSYLSNSNIRTLVRNYCVNAGVDVPTSQVSVTEESLATVSGTFTMKVVTITRPHSYILLPGFLPATSVTLTGSAKMLKET